ncbi:MAG TPA: choice-of-anchor Q domain-containing protein, partial [Iamia sp.]|nr:choice-of-anchor Q domain-containing protein [Iamia sp.]
DLEDIEIVGPAAPASGAILRGTDGHVTGSRLVSRGAESALIFTTGDVVDTVIELEGGDGVRGDGSGGALLVERVSITGDGEGIEWSGLDPDLVTVRDSTVATTGTPLGAIGEALVVRSSFRNGLGSAAFGGPTLISDSTFVVDPALDRPQLPLGAPIAVRPGADVVLQQSTVLSLATDPADSPESLLVDTGGRLILAGTAIGIGPGPAARACRGGGTFVSEGGNVVVGDTCPQIAGDQVVDDLGLEPYDSATGVAPPLAVSPVLDVVSPCRSDQDQLGQPRPSGAACDAGAVELQVATPPTTSTTSTVPGGGPGPAAPATPVVGPARFTG